LLASPLVGKSGTGATSVGGWLRMVSMPAGGGAGSPGEKFEAVGFNFNMLENEENTDDKLEGGG
jgi:hypothetical protein